MLVMRGDRLAQFGQAHHRRILVPAVDDRIGRLRQHVFRERTVRKSLPEVDRILFARKARHDLEYRDRQVGEDGVHMRGAPLTSRSAGRLPSSP